MTITDRHAHGLAGHHLRQLREKCQAATDAAFRKFKQTGPVTTAKGARRRLAVVGKSYNGIAWLHRAHVDRRGTYAAWLVPLADNDSIAVCRATLTMPAGDCAALEQRPMMIVPKHAIARGHQRLQVTDWTSVQDELKTVALYAVAVHAISAALGMKRFAIPAVRGLVIGDVTENILVGKTYIVRPLANRWNLVMNAWLRFEQRSSAVWMRAIEDLALGFESSVLPEVLGALSEELGACEFLRKPYQPGKDVEGDLWEAARQQQTGRWAALSAANDPTRCDPKAEGSSG
ncbi:MAG: hypothetical protein ACREVI_11895 [Steroidobacteraceae bacterium]